MTPALRIGDSKVLESRETDDGTTIRRRRVSADGHRFTTYERIELPQLLDVACRPGFNFNRERSIVAIAVNEPLYGLRREREAPFTAAVAGRQTDRDAAQCIRCRNRLRLSIFR